MAGRVAGPALDSGGQLAGGERADVADRLPDRRERYHRPAGNGDTGLAGCRRAGRTGMARRFACPAFAG